MNAYIIALRLVILAAIAATLANWAGSALAQSCPQVAEVQESLRAYDNQLPIFRGLIYGGEAVLEIWVGASEWTSVLIYPNGQACILDEGAYWQLLEWQEGDPA
jgi:hypothetical protein